MKQRRKTRGTEGLDRRGPPIGSQPGQVSFSSFYESDRGVISRTFYGAAGLYSDGAARGEQLRAFGV